MRTIARFRSVYCGSARFWLRKSPSYVLFRTQSCCFFPLRIAAGWLYNSSSSRWLIINHVRAHDVMCPAHAVNTP